MFGILRLSVQRAAMSLSMQLTREHQNERVVSDDVSEVCRLFPVGVLFGDFHCHCGKSRDMDASLAEWWFQ